MVTAVVLDSGPDLPIILDVPAGASDNDGLAYA
jgi:hypothetical protein